MSKILSRNEFIEIKEQKEYEELQEINEGLIKNLFGRVKNKFGGWKKIDGDEEIKRVYAELDDKLTGFSSVKYGKYDQCQEIRKQLVEFAELWYNHKKDKAEDGKNPLPAKGMKFKDETMKQNFEKCEKRIKEIAAGDAMIEKWAECLLDDMKLVINKSIISNLKGEDDIEKEKYEEEIKKQEEELKKQEDLNKKMEKIQQDSLKKIKETRNKLISDAGATPMDDKFLGDKAIQNLCGEYEKVKTDFKKDSQLGLKKLFDKKEANEPLAKEVVKVITGFYEQLEKDMDKFSFSETPGSSVQSMCIASEYAIKYALFGGNDYPNYIELMSRCSITSDISIGYGLPFIDDKKEMNYFTNFVSNSLSKLIKDKADEDAIKDSNYEANIKTLMSKIVDEAKKIKEKEEKEYQNNIEKVKKQFSK